jgi:hypothetical protein
MPESKDQPFKRLPNRPSVEAEAFVQRGPVAVPEVPIQAKEGPAPERPAKPAKKSGFTYKHLERNNELLKDLSNLLDRNMGDLIDEAIEGMIDEWKRQAAQNRNVPVSMIEQLVNRL